MIANDIILSPRATAQMRMRAYYNKATLAPSGTPAEWDRKLKAFDPKLSLRLNPESEMWCVFYEHHGMLSVIWSFGVGESFGKAFLNVQHKSTLRWRHIRKMRKAEKEAEEKQVTDAITAAGEQGGTDLHRMSKRVVTTDSVDAFAPEKPSAGGVML